MINSHMASQCITWLAPAHRIHTPPAAIKYLQRCKRALLTLQKLLLFWERWMILGAFPHFKYRESPSTWKKSSLSMGETHQINFWHLWKSVTTVCTHTLICAYKGPSSKSMKPMEILSLPLAGAGSGTRSEAALGSTHKAIHISLYYIGATRHLMTTTSFSTACILKNKQKHKGLRVWFKMIAWSKEHHVSKLHDYIYPWLSFQQFLRIFGCVLLNNAFCWNGDYFKCYKGSPSRPGWTGIWGDSAPIG